MEKSSQTIKDLPKVERPREKLIHYGPEKLSNSELLAILLRSGKRGENVVEMANKILKNFSSKNLPDVKFEELKKISGLGPAKSCEIIACFELGKRLLKGKKSKIWLGPRDVWQELSNIRDNKKEHFIIFYLDARNQKIKMEIISVGILTANIVHPREVFEPAVINLAAQIIIAHNHPSGDITPSEADIEITKKLIDAGTILGIEIIDHIIVAKNNFFSFKENGII